MEYMRTKSVKYYIYIKFCNTKCIYVKIDSQILFIYLYKCTQLSNLGLWCPISTFILDSMSKQ